MDFDGQGAGVQIRSGRRHSASSMNRAQIYYLEVAVVAYVLLKLISPVTWRWPTSYSLVQ